MNSEEQIQLIYKGVQASSGNTYDEYSDCVKTALAYHYDDIPTVYLEESDDGYQGSTFGIIRGKVKEGKQQWYYFNFGWGSCSGCDSLQGDGPIETIKGLKNDIIPIPEGKTITEYIENEINNSWSKRTIEKLLDKWRNYIKENSLNDFGSYIR